MQVATVARHARRIGARGGRARLDGRAATTSSASTPGLRVLAPEIEVLAPVRDSGVSREEETEYCASFGVAIPAKTTPLLGQRGALGHDDRRRADARPVGASAGDPLPGQHAGEGAPVARVTVVGFRKGPRRSRSAAGRPCRARARRAAERSGRRYAAGRAVHLGRYDSAGLKGTHRVRGAGGARADRGARGAGEARHDEGAAAVEGARRRDRTAVCCHERARRSSPRSPTRDAYLRGHAVARDRRGEAALLAGSVRGHRRAQPGIRSLRPPVVRVLANPMPYLSAAEAKGVGKTLALPGRLWTLAGEGESR